MDRDLKILLNTTDKLIVRSPSEHMGTFNIAVIAIVACGVAFLAYKLWSASRIASVVLVVIALVIGLIVSADRGTSYQMEMNRPQNKLVMTSFRGSNTQDELKSITLPLNDVERADMEFNRTSRRITLTMRSSKPIHPLGPDFEYMDSQFKVLGIIQNFIGQTPTPVPTQP